MAQHALILDEQMLEVISSGRILLAGRDKLKQLDDRMRRAGFFWDDVRNCYFRLCHGPPPIRRKDK